MSAGGFPCARCGRPLRRRPANATRPKHIECPRCGYVIYDYPRPAAGVLAVRGDTVLLVKRGHRPRIGFLDVPGGFIEAGEGIEQAARRELREETGIVLGRMEPLGFYWDTYSLRGFGRFPTMNWYFVGHSRRGTPHAGDDASAAEWVPIGALASLRSRWSWMHMGALFRDLRRWWRRDRSARGRVER